MSDEHDDIRLLVVGPNKDMTGGMEQYMTNQLQHVDDRVDALGYDIGPPRASGTLWFVVAVLMAVRDALLFPISCDRPDVVHVHTAHRRSFYRASFYVLFSSLVWRTRVVLHIHGSSFDEFVHTDFRIGQYVQSLTYAHTDVIVTLSKYWRDLLVTRADERKVLTIPNAVDLATYSPRYDGSTPHLTFVSALKRRKGVDEFLSAAERLASETDLDFRLSIAGDGPLRPSVEGTVGRHPNMEYLGFVSEAEKADLLSESTVFVLPSYAEGMPISILEAMAGGNAVVSTTVGSIPEVIGGDGGVLVEPGDTDALYAAIEGLVASPDRAVAMGERNRREVEDHYNWESVCDELCDVYRRLARRDTR